MAGALLPVTGGQPILQDYVFLMAVDAAAADVNFIRRAIKLAQAAARKGGGAPIGCVIVLDGEIIGEGHNQVEAMNDPTAHAEIVAIRQAGAHLKRTRFQGATLYSTLQPCGMCSMASIWAGVSRIVYGAGSEQVHRMYFESRHLEIMDFVRDAYKDDLRVEGGVLGAKCAELYYGPDDHPPQEQQANK
jgi:tRNA(adenine34) deaminase